MVWHVARRGGIMHTKLQLKNLKARAHLEDVDIEGRTILK
jgi:hypothetical protein